LTDSHVLLFFHWHVYRYFLFVSVKCGTKAVKNSYFTVCKPCIDEQQICGKCGQKQDLVKL